MDIEVVLTLEARTDLAALLDGVFAWCAVRALVSDGPHVPDIITNCPVTDGTVAWGEVDRDQNIP